MQVCYLVARNTKKKTENTTQRARYKTYVWGFCVCVCFYTSTFVTVYFRTHASDLTYIQSQVIRVQCSYFHVYMAIASVQAKFGRCTICFLVYKCH